MMTEMGFLLEVIVLAKRAAVVLAIVYSAVLIAMVIDFIAGVRKAKRAGIARTSYGFRRSVNKFCRYGTALLFSLLGDAIMIVGGIYDTPLASVVCGLLLCIIEGVSWFEKLDVKEQARLLDNMEIAAEILRQRSPQPLINELRENADAESNPSQNNESNSHEAK